jgi:hypothetical protein
MPRVGGESALHVLIRSPTCCLADIEALVESVATESERHALCNAKSTNGTTPLMIAAMSGGRYPAPRAVEMTSIARYLLDRGGAGRTITASAGKRLRAADLAEQHGKVRLAAELRALEAAQLGAWRAEQEQLHEQASGTASLADCSFAAAPAAAPPVRRCTRCGVQLRECKFTAARRAVRSGEQTNPLLAAFFADERLGGSERVMSALSSPALHALNNKREFTREFTEAAAMLFALRRLVSSEAEVGAEAEGRWHVVDLCCGKAFLATLIAVAHPDWSVTAVDLNDEAYLPHFADLPQLSNLRYLRADVLGAGFVGEVAKAVAREGGARTVVLGMHLCGLLSLRAIELAEALPEARGLSLAPCCLPGRRWCPTASWCEPGDHHAKYDRWCDFLEGKLGAAVRRRGDGGDGGPPGGSVDLMRCATCADDEPVVAVEEDAELPPPSCRREVVDAIVSSKRTLLSGVWAAGCG